MDNQGQPLNFWGILYYTSYSVRKKFKSYEMFTEKCLETSPEGKKSTLMLHRTPEVFFVFPPEICFCWKLASLRLTAKAPENRPFAPKGEDGLPLPVSGSV